MTAEVQTERSTRGSSKRVDDYLVEQGLTRADYDKMPIKKSQEPAHIEAKTFGNQFEWDFVPRKGIVTALPVRKKMGIQNVIHRVFIDGDRVMYGTPLGIDTKTGDLQYQRVFVTGSREFNLAKEKDREDFYTLIHSPALKNGVHDINGKGLIIIDNPEADAEASVRRFELSSDAAEIIRGYKDGDISDLGVLFKISPSQSPILIRGALYEKAKNDPKHFLRVYNNENRKIRTVLEKAIHYHVVTEGPEGVIFGNVSLGLRVEDAVEYLKGKLDFFGAIEQHVNTHEKGPTVKKNPVAPAPDKSGGRKLE